MHTTYCTSGCTSTTWPPRGRQKRPHGAWEMRRSTRRLRSPTASEGAERRRNGLNRHCQEQKSTRWTVYVCIYSVHM